MTPTWFITGTDTGVGKTFVTAALARELTAAGRRVAAIKPMESGCRRIDGDLWAEDAETIAAAAGGWQTPDQRCLYRFEDAVAPGVAAERVGTSIDLAAMVAMVQRVGSHADIALVEGAGGWLVPLGSGATVADLALALGVPVLVVARAGLGTINHSLLTIEAIERRALPVAGVVLSLRPEDDHQAAQSNAREIERHWGPRGVGNVWIRSSEGWCGPRPESLFHVER